MRLLESKDAQIERLVTQRNPDVTVGNSTYGHEAARRTWEQITGEDIGPATAAASVIPSASLAPTKPAKTWRCIDCDHVTTNDAVRDMHSDMYDHTWRLEANA